MSLIDSLAETLPTLYVEIQRQAPAARLFVLNYPNIVPDRLACGALDPSTAFYFNRWYYRLTSVIGSAAGAAHATLVDLSHAFTGHTMCEPQVRWVNIPILDSRHGLTALHPNAAGYQEMALRLANCVRSDLCS